MILILALLSLILSTSFCAPVTVPNEDLIKGFSVTESTTTSTTPLIDLMQIQTNAIRKILSSSLQQQQFENINNNKNNNCEDIESGIKLSIENQETNSRAFYRNQNGRSDDIADLISSTTPVSTVSNNNLNPSSNIILVPCLKQIPQSTNESLRNLEETEKLVHKIDTAQSYVLEKVYSPNGYLLYYMYRMRNANPEQQKTIETTMKPTTSTNNPFYSQQLKFVVQMPYENPEEQLYWQGQKFDQFAYYPKELQPLFVNGPVPYKPTFHMIKTLVIPKQHELDDDKNI